MAFCGRGFLHAAAPLVVPMVVLLAVLAGCAGALGEAPSEGRRDEDAHRQRGVGGRGGGCFGRDEPEGDGGPDVRRKRGRYGA